MNCDQAMRVIVASAVTDDSAEIRAALAYIARHPRCLARLDQFTRALLSDLEHELPCAEAREQFFTYYTLETDNQDVASRLPDVYNHLQRCPYCKFDYRTMKAGILAYEQHLLPLPTQTPQFALSFLPPLSPPPALWSVRNQIRTFVEEISILIAQSVATFGALHTGLTPALSPATQLRNGEQSARYAVLILPDADANIRFHIETATIDQTHVRVVLQVFDAVTDKTVAGVRVTLRTAQRELLTSLLTESDGKATFSRLVPGKYLFQLRQQDATWELPVVIVTK